MNQRVRKRENYLDNIKGFTMLMVVWAHSGAEHISGTMFNWMNSFHVPVFFVVAGIQQALSDKDYSTESYPLKKRLKAYLIPYYVFGAIYVALTLGIKAISGSGGGGAPTLQTVIEYALNLLLLKGPNAVWFIPCLLLADIFFYLLMRYIKNRKIVAAIIAVLALVSFSIGSGLIGIRVVYVVVRSFAGLALYGVGFLIGKYAAKWERQKAALKYTAVLIAVVYVVCVAALNGNITFWALDFGYSQVAGVVTIFVSSALVVYVFKRFLDRPIPYLTKLGRNTMIVLATHQIILDFLWTFDGHYLGILARFGITESVVVLVIIMALEVPVCYLLNHQFKFLMGKS